MAAKKKTTTRKAKKKAKKPASRSSKRTSAPKRKTSTTKRPATPVRRAPALTPAPTTTPIRPIDPNQAPLKAGERRRFERVPRALKVRLFAGAEGSGYLEAHAESLDMSLSGMFLRSTFFLPEGCNVRVELDGPYGQTASARGEVVRVQRAGTTTGLGIRFTDLDAAGLRDLVCIFVGDRIERYVQEIVEEKEAAGRRAARPEHLWEAILGWEMERLDRLFAGDPSFR